MSWKDKLEAQRADPHGLAGWLVARLLLLQPAARARIRWAVSLLELKPADRVLDVGIGPGYSTGLIAATVPEGLVVGVDRSALMTAIARRRLRRYLRLRKVTLVCADVADLPRFDVSFDKVVSVDALNLESESGALSRVRERMTPGGRIVVLVQPRTEGTGAQALGSLIAERLQAAGFERSEAHFNAAHSRLPAVCVTARA